MNAVQQAKMSPCHTAFYFLPQRILRPDGIALHPLVHPRDNLVNQLRQRILRDQPGQPLVPRVQPRDDLLLLKLSCLRAVEPFSFDRE